MCRELFGTAVEPPNDKCRLYTQLLMGMVAVQVLITISAFVFDDIPQGIFALIFIPLLLCAWWQLQYTILMIYVIVCIVLYVMALAYALGKYHSSAM